MPARARVDARHAHRHAGLEVGRARGDGRRLVRRAADLRGARGRQLVGRLLRARRRDRRRPASCRRPCRRGPPASVGRSALVAVAWAVPMTSFFATGSQPRTSTLLTCATALIRARNSSRSSPQTSGRRVGAQGLALGRAGRRLDRLLEQQLLAVDPAVVADLAGEARTGSRGPTGSPGRRGRGVPSDVVDVGREPGVAGELGRDVRVLHVLEGLRLASRGQPVRAVVAADDRARAVGAVLGLDRRDLARRSGPSGRPRASTWSRSRPSSRP